MALTAIKEVSACGGGVPLFGDKQRGIDHSFYFCREEAPLLACLLSFVVLLPFTSSIPPCLFPDKLGTRHGSGRWPLLLHANNSGKNN